MHWPLQPLETEQVIAGEQHLHPMPEQPSLISISELEQFLLQDPFSAVQLSLWGQTPVGTQQVQFAPVQPNTKRVSLIGQLPDLHVPFAAVQLLCIVQLLLGVMLSLDTQHVQLLPKQPPCNEVSFSGQSPVLQVPF